MDRPSYVYVLRHPDGLQKIGLSADPESRSRTLRYKMGGPCPGPFFGLWPRQTAYAVEQKAHEILSKVARGGELFETTAEEAVAAVLKAVEELGLSIQERGEVPEVIPARQRRPPPRRSRAHLTRVQLDLPPRSVERVERLKEMTEAGTRTEVIRYALRLYEAMIKEARGGADFYIKRPGSDAIVPYPVFVE